MTRVLLVEDDRLSRQVARDALAHAGFSVDEAADGASGLRLLFEHHPDLVILDILMPAMDGWTACSRIREVSEVPIIMLTSLDREEEIIKGLGLGADDFLSKPVSPGHLVARVHAILRRSQGQSAESTDFRYDDGELRIDAGRHEVEVGGRRVDLTATEFRLLVALARKPGFVHGYASLLTAIWGPEYASDVDFLRVYVWRLRKKLEQDPEEAGWITNERSTGYRFRPRDPA